MRGCQMMITKELLLDLLGIGYLDTSQISVTSASAKDGQFVTLVLVGQGLPENIPEIPASGVPEPAFITSTNPKIETLN